MKLELSHISKKYSHKSVLEDVSLVFEPGQIHGLLGQNGAGKTTLAKIISGQLQSDSGTVLLDDQPVLFKTPKDAINHSISYVHQTPLLAEEISIKENLSLGLKKNSLTQMQSLVSLWLKDRPLKTPVKNLSSDEKFFTALSYALLQNPSLLILDEPTALLDNSQRIFLYRNLTELASKGMNIIVITHNLDEAEKYCNTISFLKEGKVLVPEPGQNLKNLFSDTSTDLKMIRNPKNLNEDFFQIENLTVKQKDFPSLFNLSFKAYGGQITLIKGLPEDGLGTLENLLSGMNCESSSGKLTFSIKNTCCTFTLPRDSFNTRILRNLRNINTAIIPTDSKKRGSNGNLKVKQIFKNTKQAQELIKKAQIEISPEEAVSNLSGGMLQKLIITREFSKKPRLILLFNPMQGLDAAICPQIYEQIKEMTAKGSVVLVLSTGTFDSDIADKIYELKAGDLKCTTLE